MLDIAHIFMGTALAQAANAPADASPGGSIGIFLPLVLILGVFYVLLMRPQQKKMDELARMIKALKRGDRIVTAGGIHGKITKLEGEDTLIVEIADGVQVKVVRSTITALAAKTEPALAKPDEPESEPGKKD